MPLLPTYISQANPTAGFLSPNVPTVPMDGIKNLTAVGMDLMNKTLEFRDDVNANKALKDYNTQIITLRKDYLNNATLDNIDSMHSDFMQKTNNALDESFAKYGVSMKRAHELRQRISVSANTESLNFSATVMKDVQAKALSTHIADKEDFYGQLFSSATPAQLRGTTGTEMLSQQLKAVDEDAELMHKAGLVPASEIDAYKAGQKRKLSNYYWGRYVATDPQGALNFATRNSAQVVQEQITLYNTTKSSGKYISVINSADPVFKEYQKALKSLPSDLQAQLIVQKMKLGNVEAYNSTNYDLGGLYKEAKQMGISFKDALNDSNLRARYATPYSPFFTNNSKFYSEKTKDYAGTYHNGVYIPANLTPGTKYFNEDLKYTSVSALQAIQDAAATYAANNRKQQQEEKSLALAQQLYQLNKQMDADNITGLPTNVIYPNGNGARDVYSNLPTPVSPANKEYVKSIIKQEAKAAGVPVAAAMALFERESGFNSNARGGSGEYGLGQLMPTTAKGLGVQNPWDARENIKASLKYFKIGLKEYGGNAELAYARYNGGPGNVKHYKNGRANKVYKNNVAAYTKILGKYETYGI